MPAARKLFPHRKSRSPGFGLKGFPAANDSEKGFEEVQASLNRMYLAPKRSNP